MTEDENSDKFGRVRRFKVTPEALVEMFKESNSVTEVVDGLPEDAEFVRMIEDEEDGCFWIYAASNSFDYVWEGAKVPVMGEILFESHPKEELG